MGKRKKAEDAGSAPAAAPFNPAFAGLAGLRAEMPNAPDTRPEPAEEAPSPPGPRGKIVVTRERKGRGGKTVTRVARLGYELSGLEQTLDTLKRTLGCAGTVEEEDLILSGDQTGRVAEWLRAELGRKVVVGN